LNENRPPNLVAKRSLRPHSRSERVGSFPPVSVPCLSVRPSATGGFCIFGGSRKMCAFCEQSVELSCCTEATDCSEYAAYAADSERGTCPWLVSGLQSPLHQEHPSTNHHNRQQEQNMGRRRGTGRRKVGRKKRRMRSKIRHRK